MFVEGIGQAFGGGCMYVCVCTHIATFTWLHSADVESWFSRVSGVQRIAEHQEDVSRRQILSNCSSLFELIKLPQPSGPQFPL